MKKLVLTTAILGVLASPAFAKDARDAFAQAPPATKHRTATATQIKTFDVVVDGKVIGKAPDEAIRGAMMNDYYGAKDGGGDSGGGSSSE